MGDGCVKQSSRNPNLSVAVIEQDFLKYISEVFGVLGNDVRLMRSSEESAEQNRVSKFSPNAEADNYSDLYEWKTVNHPELLEFRNWYSSGKKVWPDINLTPTVLKYWYCCDGTYDTNNLQNRIILYMSNEVDNTEKVNNMFTKSGLPKPNNYMISERESGHIHCHAQFTVSQTQELFRYMGEPLPGFEYKWPKELSKQGGN